MAKCVHHPGRKSATKVGGNGYCERCEKDMKAAVKKVDKHVAPKDCFIWYKNAREGWQPITGTGCAHWVAHEKNIKRGKNRCLAGYTGRVKDLVKAFTPVKDTAKVKKGCLWVADGFKHCGLVKSVKKGKDGKPEITIEHDSVRQGKVAVNDWQKHFKGQGTFYK